jgi:hypothetical protein
MVVTAVFVVIRDANSPPSFHGVIQEIEHGNQEEARREHGNGPEDPQKEWEREIEGTQP